MSPKQIIKTNAGCNSFVYHFIPLLVITLHESRKSGVAENRVEDLNNCRIEYRNVSQTILFNFKGKVNNEYSFAYGKK